MINEYRFPQNSSNPWQNFPIPILTVTPPEGVSCPSENNLSTENQKPDNYGYADNGRILHESDEFLTAFCSLSNLSVVDIRYSEESHRLRTEIEKIRVIFLENFHSRKDFKLYGIAAYPGSYLKKPLNNSVKQVCNLQHEVGSEFFHMKEIYPILWKLSDICGATLTETLERHSVIRFPFPKNHEEIEVFHFKWKKDILNVTSNDGITFKILASKLKLNLKGKDPEQIFSNYSSATLRAFFGYFYLDLEEFKTKSLNSVKILDLLRLADECGHEDLVEICANKLAG